MLQKKWNALPFCHCFVVFVTLLALLNLLGPAFARGNLNSGDRWIKLDAGYLRWFPAEVRSAIEAQVKVCGAHSAVRQSFAHYIHIGSSQHKFIALHFVHFRCADQSRFCGSEGCLHQVYAPVGASYRLVLNARVDDVELAVINGRIAVRVECANIGSQRCPRTLLWTGSRLVEGH